MLRLFLVLVALSLTMNRSLLLGGPANDRMPVWSPDGSRIAFLHTESEAGPSTFTTFDLAISQAKQVATVTPSAYPVWSPDGAQIAYVENGTQTHCIHLMNADGSQDRCMAERSGVIEELAWSPDGRRIVSFSSGDIFVVTLSDGRVDVLANEDVTGAQPLWSPNGNQLLYVKQVEPSGKRAVVLVNADGSNAQTVIDRPLIVSAIWSPLGNQIAFVYQEGDHHELAVVNLDGSGFTRLTAGKAVESHLSWSPDGSKIAYIHDDHIYIVAVDGTLDSIFQNWADRQFLPSWSPDGNWLAFISDSGIRALYVISTGIRGYQRFELDSAVTPDYYSWSPDSTRIILHSYQPLYHTSLCAIDAKGGAVTTLAQGMAIDNFAWSPDGEKIAFAGSDLYVVDGDGTDLHKLSANRPVSSYQWSPDSQELAFAGDGLNVVNADGTEMLKLSELSIDRYAWSPVGKRIAFTDGELYLVDSSGSNLKQVTSFGAPELGSPFFAWSPDGTELLLSVGRIYVVDADGNNLRQLTFGPDHWGPTWSPDGTRIAFMDYAALHLIDANGANHQRLSSDDGDAPGAFAPVWSPDGRKLLFSNTKRYTYPPSPAASAPFDLYLINADGSNQRLLTYSYHTTVDPPRWSPDGSVIVYHWGGYSSLFHGDGSEWLHLTENDIPESYPSFAPDGHRFVFAREIRGNSELYVAAINR